MDCKHCDFDENLIKVLVQKNNHTLSIISLNKRSVAKHMGKINLDFSEVVSLYKQLNYNMHRNSRNARGGGLILNIKDVGYTSMISRR